MNLLVAIVLLLLGLASADLAQAQDPPQAWPPFAMDACSSTDLGPSAANSGWPGLFRRAEITCSGLYEGITQVTVSCTIDPSGPSVQDNSRFVATCLQRSAGLTLRSIFRFGNERCDRVVMAVMARIGAGD